MIALIALLIPAPKQTTFQTVAVLLLHATPTLATPQQRPGSQMLTQPIAQAPHARPLIIAVRTERAARPLMNATSAMRRKPQNTALVAPVTMVQIMVPVV